METPHAEYGYCSFGWIKWNNMNMIHVTHGIENNMVMHVVV